MHNFSILRFAGGLMYTVCIVGSNAFIFFKLLIRESCISRTPNAIISFKYISFPQRILVTTPFYISDSNMLFKKV
jgi:hypothetical protein